MCAQGTRQLALDGELTVYRTNELKIQLLAAALEGGDLELDLSRVTEIDTAGVQLLLALSRVMAARGAALHLARLSEPVQEAFGLLGLDRRFAA